MSLCQNKNRKKSLTITKSANSNLQHQLARHYIRSRQSGTLSACSDRHMQQLQLGLSHLVPAQQLSLTLDKKPQTPSFKGKDDPSPDLKLDIPANLQVGAYRAAVYTTKIILALARGSKQQSQPFMVRVEINIAESRVWGARRLP